MGRTRNLENTVVFSLDYSANSMCDLASSNFQHIFYDSEKAIDHHCHSGQDFFFLLLHVLKH